MLELGAAQVLQEMLPHPVEMNVRGFAQEGPALGGEAGDRAAFVALEDTAPHEAPALELVDRPGHPAGREDDP